MEHGSKNKSMKNHNRKHYRDLWRAMSLYMSMIVSSCSSLRIFSSSKSIRISWSILCPLRDLHKGKTRLMTEKHAHLTSFILFGKLRTETSEHIFEYALVSVGLIVFKYSSFCLISPWRTFCWAWFLAWSFNSLSTLILWLQFFARFCSAWYFIWPGVGILHALSGYL